jgi:VWFA-related protein
LVVIAAAVCAPRAGAQAPPSFETRAELVTVDVVVLGPDGKPVPGLARDDFVVKEDGRPQTIAAFEAVEALVPEGTGLVTAASSPSRPHVATNLAAPATQRTFAIVFDDLHVGDLNIENAKKAIAAFVTQQTVPGDRVLLATVSDGHFWATAHARDDAAWREALARVGSHRRLRGRPECEPTYYEAMQINLLNNSYVAALVGRRIMALCVPPTMRPSPEQLASGALPREAVAQSMVASPTGAEAYARHREQLAGTLRVLREIVTRLGEARGRKALILITEGFPSDTSLDVFREVRERAARANVVVNFLDARGLAAGPEFMSASGSTGMIPGGDIGPTVAMWKLEDGGAKALAEETGGRVLQTNDLVSALKTVAEEARVTYLLGYEPTNEKRDGRYRKLKVEVRRPGLRVRARAGYFASKGGEQPTPQPRPVERAMSELFDSEAIPLRLAAYVMGPAAPPTPGAEVLIVGELRIDALAAQGERAGRLARPRLTLVTSARGGEGREQEWPLEVATPSGAGRSPTDLWLPFVTRIGRLPGDYRARLVAQSGDLVGSVTLDFVVPPLTAERLSTPILSDQLVANASDRRLVPIAHRSFSDRVTLHCWIELVGAGADPATGQPRASAVFVARALDGREWASGAPTAMKADGGRLTRLLDVPLADAPPGEHELVLRVKDEVSGATFEAREPFRVEGRQATAE